jgi:hypothetical protein
VELLSHLWFQLRAITTKIVSSPQRRAKFRKIAISQYGNDPLTKERARLMVVRDVCTHWNYTNAMIRRALLLEEVFKCTFLLEKLLTDLIENRQLIPGHMELGSFKVLGYRDLIGSCWDS